MYAVTMGLRNLGRFYGRVDDRVLWWRLSCRNGDAGTQHLKPIILN